MKHKLSTTLALVVVTMALAASGARAQTVAPGPYYANPSWDQQLPAATRFIVLSNWGSAAVLDRETALVWEKSPSTTSKNWFDARSRCSNLIVGNRLGWRLPTLQELASLVDPSVASPGPTLPNGHPFIVQAAEYWSASTHTFADITATTGLYVQFFNGSVVGIGKTNNLLVWCVRGGQGIDPQ